MLNAFLLGLILSASLVVADVARQEKQEYSWKLLEFANDVLTTAELMHDWEARAAAAEEDEGVLQPVPIFDCNIVTSSSLPTSVHELRPGDINVVAAYGDSITAGNGLGANTPLEVAIENRGESWSIGGDKSLDEGVITIPNLLRKFNPHVKGASVCYSVEEEEKYAWMNLASPGGKSNWVLGQTKDIIARMQADPRIDFENDWKMVTLFFGGNDLCQACESPDRYDPKGYRTSIEEGIVMMKQQVPRVYFNIVTMFDISPVQNFTVGNICLLAHWGFCQCAMNKSMLEVYNLHEIQQGYYTELKAMVDEGQYESDDFTLVLQPHLRDMPLPYLEDGEPDMSWLSYDCFHPARKSHQYFAYSLWNTMLMAVGQKPCTWPKETSLKYFCPTEEHPYLFTNNNSVGSSYVSPFSGPYC